MQAIVDSRIYHALDRFTKLIYLNLLWFIFSLLGGIVLGVFPATAAVYAIIRKWANQDEIPIFSTFWAYYKKEFKKSLITGYSFFLIWLLLHEDLKIYDHGILNIVVHLLSLIFFIMLVYIGPVFANYEAGFFKQVKLTILLALAHPIKSVFMMALTLGYIYFIFSLAFFKFVPLCGITLFAFLCTQVVRTTFPEPKQMEES